MNNMMILLFCSETETPMLSFCCSKISPGAKIMNIARMGMADGRSRWNGDQARIMPKEVYDIGITQQGRILYLNHSTLGYHDVDSEVVFLQFPGGRSL